MPTYQVFPSGEESLFELMMVKDSPGGKFFESISGRPYIFQGHSGFRVGEVFYSANPDYTNVLTVKGMADTPYSIEMSVTSITTEPDSLTFSDKDSNSRLTVTSQGFTLDIGMPVEPKTMHKPSPWK